MKRSKWGVLVVLLAGSLLLSGCSDQDLRDLADIGRMWARSHGLLDETGKPDYWNIGTRVMGGSTGDEEADAAIDAGVVVDNFQNAEKLRDEAVAAKDMDKLDSAIKLRPKEFRYHNDRGALLLQQGRIDEGYQEFDKADEIVKPYGRGSQIRNLDSRISALERMGPPLVNRASMAEYQLILWRKKYALTNDPRDKKAGDLIEYGLEKGYYIR